MSTYDDWKTTEPDRYEREDDDGDQAEEEEDPGDHHDEDPIQEVLGWEPGDS